MVRSMEANKFRKKGKEKVQVAETDTRKRKDYKEMNIEANKKKAKK
jgi:hypothetical protein